MPDDVTITGAEQFQQLAKRCKEMGDEGKGFRKELNAGVQRSTKPVRAEIKANIGRTFPHRGGLSAEMVKTTKLSARSATGTNPGVRIVAKGGHDIYSMDKGELRHPALGTTTRRTLRGKKVPRPRDKWKWVAQRIRDGWFSKPAEQALPAVQAEISRVMDDVAKRIEG